MTDVNHISDGKLPVEMDFNQLKAQALAFIQTHGGSKWTNFNASDAGVTILDQVCYALTELGYCTHFSIEDLLTNADGTIGFADQFYAPEEILTTAPVTIDDYRKLICARFGYVLNVYMRSTTVFLPNSGTIYQVYLKLQPNSGDPEQQCKEVFYFLNQHRNLTTFFHYPLPLSIKNVMLCGTIEIETATEVTSVLNALNVAARELIFPPVTITPKKEAEAIEGEDELYDGPFLKEGFVLDENLADKLNAVSSYQLIRAIANVEGISQIVSLKFGRLTEQRQTATCGETELLYMDWLTSFINGDLIFVSNGQTVSLPVDFVYNNTPADLTLQYAPIEKTSKARFSGTFRDVNNYYSIQNTFPAVYGIGEANAGVKKTTLEQAQTNQLIGYLSLFDQVLANQFTQLANIDQLFSFKNAGIANPSAYDVYKAKQNKLAIPVSEYPVPFQVFSPTYFYQTLYDTPNIRPVLKGYETFDYSTELQTKDQQQETSWKKYKNDPYNAYQKGLLNLIANDTVNWERRKALLDHLLARHGESPARLSTYLKYAQFTGNLKQDELIFKSLFLQNLGQLSYHQAQSYDLYTSAKIMASPDNGLIPLSNRATTNWSTDAIFNSDRVDEAEKVHSTDFINFAGIELKTRLLFGLRPLYTEFINETTATENAEKHALQAQQLRWFNSQRQGFILIENGALCTTTIYTVNFKLNNESWQISTEVPYNEMTPLVDWIVNHQQTFEKATNEVTISFMSQLFTAEKADELDNDTDRSAFGYTEDGVKFSFYVEDSNLTDVDADFEEDVLFIFPSYVPRFQSVQFQQLMTLYFQENLPFHVMSNVIYADEQALESFIPVYTAWFNGLHYKSPPDDTTTVEPADNTLELQALSTNLRNALKQLKQSTPANE